MKASEVLEKMENAAAEAGVFLRGFLSDKKDFKVMLPEKELERIFSGEDQDADDLTISLDNREDIRTVLGVQMFRPDIQTEFCLIVDNSYMGKRETEVVPIYDMERLWFAVKFIQQQEKV